MGERGGVSKSGLGCIEGGVGLRCPCDFCASWWVVCGSEVVQRCQESSGVWDEAVIEVDHPEEAFEMFLGLGTSELLDACDAVHEGRDASG